MKNLPLKYANKILYYAFYTLFDTFRPPFTKCLTFNVPIKIASKSVGVTSIITGELLNIFINIFLNTKILNIIVSKDDFNLIKFNEIELKIQPDLPLTCSVID